MRLIDADALKENLFNYSAPEMAWDKEDLNHKIDEMPTVEPEPKKGKWIDRTVDVDAKKSIEEWQCAKCSVCGLYHTTPYAYYFDDFKYCPNCGARMEVDE